MKLKESTQVLLIVIGSVACTVAVSVVWRAFGLSLNDAGGLGDWIAGSTSVFIQAIIVFYLIKTYRSQKKELEEQRNLLKLAHAESQRKRFEDGFYQLLARYENVVQGLVLPGNDTYRARRIFPGAASECMSLVSSAKYASEVKDFFSSRDWWLGDWIRAVFMTVTYIRESDRTPAEQIAYLKIFRGIVSPPEAQLLLAYAMTKVKGGSETAQYLLQNQFFKYSYVSREKAYDRLNEIMIDLHSYPIYASNAIPTPDSD